MVISNAKLTVLAAALAAAGAILNSIDASPLIAILWAVACAICGLCYVFKRASLSHSINFFRNTQLTPIERAPRLRLRAMLTVVLLSMTTLAYFEYAQLRNMPTANDLVKFSGQDVIFIATCSKTDCQTATREVTLNCESLLFPKAQSLSGKTLLAFRKTPEQLAQVGLSTTEQEQVRVKIRGHVYQPRKNPPAWEYDKRKKIAALGIYSICNLERCGANSSQSLELEASTAKPRESPLPGVLASLGSMDDLSARYESAMSKARTQIVQTHRKYLPAKLADLLSSMVLGNRAVAVSVETTHKFRDVGLSHILAASGFNLTIVTVMSFALCRLVTPSVVLANIGCFLSMLGFVSLAGPSPSVLRAALMCTIMLITKSGQRRTLVLPALALAFLLTVTADPLCTNDLGLQLSYAATVGIVLGSRALAKQLYPGKSKWRCSLADAIAVVLIAQFSVMPIQLFFFWRAGTMFIPANLLITPLVTPLTMVGFASSTLALFNIPYPALDAALSYIIAFADAVAFIPLTMMVLMVNAFASFDAANFTLGPPSAFSVILYYVCFLLYMLSLQLQTKIRWSTAAFAGTLILLLWRSAPPMLTIANVHAHTILINSNHQAIDIDSKEQPNKTMERFFAFNGATYCPTSFSTGTLKSGARYIKSQNWLLVMHSDRWQPHFPSESAEILLTARKMQCRNIVVLVPQADDSNQFLPASEFTESQPNQDTEPKLIGFRNVSAFVYTKK